MKELSSTWMVAGMALNFMFKINGKWASPQNAFTSLHFQLLVCKVNFDWIVSNWPSAMLLPQRICIRLTFCVYRWAFLVVNVDGAVKNQWTGDTFFTLILKINIWFLYAFLKNLNFFKNNICTLKSNVIVFLVFLAVSTPSPSPQNLKAA